MEIQELDKKQLILLTLLITFVVSIATGIVTVSLVNQAPKSVPQTINNVIQRTIEKVTTIPAPASTGTPTQNTSTDSNVLSATDEVLIPIYSSDATVSPASSAVKSTTPSTGQEASSIGSIQDAGSVAGTSTTKSDATSTDKLQSLGSGVIISDVGLVLVDTTILTSKDIYKVILNGTDFDASVIKRFTNGFTILKISVKKQGESKSTIPVDSKKNTNLDNKQ